MSFIVGAYDAKGHRQVQLNSVQLQLVQSTAQREFTTALAELQRYSAEQATARFHQRHDVLVNAAFASAPVAPACREGCAFCCFYQVGVYASEMLLIEQYLRQHYAAAHIEQLVKTAEQALASDELQTACPLLVERRCSIYPVRPVRCRNHHALDVNACKASFEHPEDADQSGALIEQVFLVANGAVHGFSSALKQRGLDAQSYPFSAAFIQVMRHPSVVRRRWKAGKKSLPGVAAQDD